MSRLIVKNLPRGMKEDRFRTLFAAFGTLTDCSLKFTKEGKFRKFGFIGFSSEEEAKSAFNHFNKSFIDTARVSVEFCKSFGDPTKAKAWSKHSQKPEKPEKLTKKSLVSVDKKKVKEKGKAVGALEVLKNDDAFEEFLSVHKNRTQVATWANDTLTNKSTKVEAKQTSDYLNFDSDSSADISDDDEGIGGEEERGSSSVPARKDGVPSVAVRTELSDMDYLKSKVVKDSLSVEEEDEDRGSSSEAESDEEGENRKTGVDGGQAQQKHTVLEKKEIKDQSHGTEKKKGLKAKSVSIPTSNEPTTQYTVKLRGAPFNVTEQNVREFLVPLRPAAIRIVKNTHGNKTGYIFVDLNSEDEVQKALKKSNDYMGGRYIEVFRDERALESKTARASKDRPWQKREKKDDEEEEDVSESGRLFVRNLPYSCTEDELQKMFSEYGPLSEIHFPIDSLTKKPKGFAFVTFMIPEHAVKAYAEVDGKVFQVFPRERRFALRWNCDSRLQPVAYRKYFSYTWKPEGRMLHVLPSTIKKEEMEADTNAAGSSAFKKQKAAKDKANSTSAHNWNTLFMGTSAVADAIAQKYSTTKSQVLDDEGRGSLAVRVALGETQLVQDVRQFLVDNGVALDCFSQAAGERSKSVILAKNLPVGTKTSELEEVFGRHGDLGRVLLPEGGITAIVEFLEPTEAKRAFSKLAYSKFQHVPLYLEWAPMGVFSAAAATKKSTQTEKENTRSQADADAPEEVEMIPAEAVNEEALEEENNDEAEEEEEEEEEEDSIPGCTLFIKNLNFITTEETLQTTFSKVGLVKKCTISKKKDKSGTLLSMGFGFVEYKKPEHAQKAIRQLQHCVVDEHQLEVKLSERAVKPAITSTRKKQSARKQLSSKILVRNIPFQATVREIRELFSTFGELKTVRLPKKVSGTGPHRGFGFVDFITKQDAKKAFTSLCHSTHLYGRRLVLEWADAEDSVETLRRKTAEHFHDATKKSKQSAKLDNLLETMAHETEDE